MELCAIPSYDEIFQAIKQINPNSAPGHDGFTGHFSFVQDYFNAGYLHGEISKLLLS